MADHRNPDSSGDGVRPAEWIDVEERPSYAAFISYNREEDSKLAWKLRQALHRFAKPWYRLRAVRVFLDDASQSADTALLPSVQNGLDCSEFLIVLASPKAAKSVWVDKEIRYWLDTKKSSQNIMIALTSGELKWDEVAEDFDNAVTTSLPAALRGVFTHHPRYVDLRPVRNLDRLPRMLIADLATPLHHRPKDEMIGEDVRQYRRVRLLVTSAVVTLFVLALTATVFGIDSRNQAREADRQRRLAEKQTCLVAARHLVTQSQATVGQDPAAALRMAVSANTLLPGPETETNAFALLSSSHFAGTLPGPGYAGAAIGTAALTRDGDILATGHVDGKVLLWNVDRTRMDGLAMGPVSEQSTTWGIRSLAFSADGRILAGGINRTVILWNVSDPARPRPLGSPIDQAGEVYSLALSPDGHTLAVDVRDKGLVLWNVSDPAHPRTIRSWIGAGEPVFSPDGRRLAAVEGARSVVLWNLADPARPRRVGRPLAGVTGPQPDLGAVASGRQQLRAVHSVVFSSDGNTLASGSDDRTVVLWNVTNPTRAHRIGMPLRGHNGPVRSVAFAPDGHTLASGSDDHTVILWDVTDLIHPRRIGPLLGQPDAAVSVMFGAGGATLASYYGIAVTLWDLAKSTQPSRTGSLAGHTGLVNATTYSPDGNTLATGSDDRTVILWDVSNSALAHRIGMPLRGHNGPVRSVVFSPDGNTVASGSDDRTVILWDVSNPARAHRIARTPSVPDPSNWPAFPPPAPYKSWFEVYLYGHSGPIYSVVFSPDGNTLATAGEDRSGILWDVSQRGSPMELTTLSGHNDAVLSLAFDRDGHTLATASRDGAVILWDVASQIEPRQIGAPLAGSATGPILSMAVASDGRMVAVGGIDGALVLWDVTDPNHPRRVGSPLRHSGAVASIAFSPDADSMAIASGTDTAILWDLTSLLDLRAHAVERASALAGGGLIFNEWAQELPGLAEDRYATIRRCSSVRK